MAKTTTSLPRQARNKKFILVRYGRMETLGWFEHNQPEIPRTPTRVVVKTEKGLELGSLVGQLCCYKHGNLKFDREDLRQYFEESQIDFPEKPAGKVLRFATHADISEEKHLIKIAEEEIKYCKKIVAELGLPMKIVDAEHIFGGERIIFYFMADARVDFRELVKKLAHEYQSRIEMRQVGARDEARLLGDYETCGQQCCCKQFLKALKPVNMRMAKMQKATLDPSKISGYCGRLKCCLRFEDKTYTELKKKLPRKGTMVSTPNGNGKVIDSQILTQLVIVEVEGSKRVAIPNEDLEIISEPMIKRKKKENQKNNRNNNSNRNNSTQKPKNNNENNKAEKNKDKNDGQENNRNNNSNRNKSAQKPENNNEKNNTENNTENNAENNKDKNTGQENKNDSQ